jgi:methyl-accepting chemotaxis protein
MLNPKSLSTKVHIPLIAIFILGLAIIVYVTYKGVLQVEKGVYEKELKPIVTYLNKSIQARKDSGVSNALLTAQNRSLKESIMMGDAHLTQKILQENTQAVLDNTEIKNFEIGFFSKEQALLNGAKKSVFESSTPLSTVLYEENTLFIKSFAPMLGIFGNGIGVIEVKQSFDEIIHDLRNNLNAHLAIKVNDQIIATQDDANFVKQIKALKADAQKNFVTTKHFLVTAIDLKGFENTNVATLFVAKPLQQAKKSVDQFVGIAVEQLIVVTLIDIVVLILLIIIINKAVKKPLKVFEKLEKSQGDLTQRLPVQSNDEVGVASKRVNSFIQKVQDIINNTKKSSAVTVETVQTVRQSAQLMQQRFSQSSQNVQALVQISSSAKSIIGQSNELSQTTMQKVRQTQEDLTQTQQNLSKLVAGVEQNAQNELDVAARLNGLNEEAQKVKEVLAMIQDIADQTNLLSLNAAIEAARAGTHGRGFAVVADEVRKLADKTQKSLTQIDATISVIVQSIVQSSNHMNQNAKASQKLLEYSNDAGAMMQNSLTNMDAASGYIEQSVEQSISVSKEVEQILDKIHLLQSLETSNVKSAKQMSQAIENLSNVVSELNVKLEGFIS